MFKRGGRARIGVPLLVLALILIWAEAGLGHEQRSTGGHDVVVGWEVEPAFASFPNAVGVKVTRQGSGEPVTGLRMKVEVLFGDRNSPRKTAPLDLTPAFDEPGKYEAPIVPSRPGTYTFHLTGRLGSESLDQYFTSGENTFDSVEDPQEFPVDDPSQGELAERLTRVDARIQDSADTAEDAGKTARNLALAGLALSVIGLLVALSAISQAKGAATKVSGSGRSTTVQGSTDEK